MAESRTCYMSNIELVCTEDCCGWRDMRFIYHCSCILQFTQHLRISSVLHELASQVQSIRVHPSAAVPHTGALSVCGVRALERAGRGVMLAMSDCGHPSFERCHLRSRLILNLLNQKLSSAISELTCH